MADPGPLPAGVVEPVSGDDRARNAAAWAWAAGCIFGGLFVGFVWWLTSITAAS